VREKYCWLVAGGWFVLRENYCWMLADKPNEQGAGEVVPGINSSNQGHQFCMTKTNAGLNFFHVYKYTWEIQLVFSFYYFSLESKQQLTNQSIK
jgi:hypothetical protein